MQKEMGIVKKVFIPTEYDGKKVDIMRSTKIGFKIEVNGNIITIIQDQNDINTKMLREDKVYLIKINNEYQDIAIYDGE